MGQIPQDGENEQNVAYFFYFVTKRFDIFMFSFSYRKALFRPQKLPKKIGADKVIFSKIKKW